MCARSGMANFRRESNGRGGSRPGAGRPRLASERERQVVEAARAEGRAAMPRVVRLWVEGLDHRCDDPRHDDYDYRLACGKQLANRCGLPGLREIKAELAPTLAPVRTYSFPDPFVEAGLVETEGSKRHDA